MTHSLQIAERQKELAGFLENNREMLAETNAGAFIEQAIEELEAHIGFAAENEAVDLDNAAPSDFAQHNIWNKQQTGVK